MEVKPRPPADASITHPNTLGKSRHCASPAAHVNSTSAQAAFLGWGCSVLAPVARCWLLSRPGPPLLLLLPAGHRSRLPHSLPLKRGMLHYAYSRKMPVQVSSTHSD